MPTALSRLQNATPTEDQASMQRFAKSQAAQGKFEAVGARALAPCFDDSQAIWRVRVYPWFFVSISAGLLRRPHDGA